MSEAGVGRVTTKTAWSYRRAKQQTGAQHTEAQDSNRSSKIIFNKFLVHFQTQKYDTV